MTDLRSFIISKDDYIDLFKESDFDDALLVLYNMLQKCFNISYPSFLDSLEKDLDRLITDGLISYEMFSQIRYFIHFEEYEDFSTDYLLQFILDCLIPECNIIEHIEETGYFASDDSSSDDPQQRLEWLLQRLTSDDRIIAEAKEELTKWLEDGYIEFVSDSEYVSTTIVVLSSPYIYHIWKDEKLEKIFSGIFDGWNYILDEEKKIGYLWYGIIKYEEETQNDFELYNWEEANNLIKEKFNLEYDNKNPKISKILKDYKLYLTGCCPTSRFIVSVKNAFDTKKEVMF